MFCDPLPLQLLSKNDLISFFWNWVDLPPSYLDDVFKYTGFFFGDYPLMKEVICGTTLWQVKLIYPVPSGSIFAGAPPVIKNYFAAAPGNEELICKSTSSKYYTPQTEKQSLSAVFFWPKNLLPKSEM